ncbi:hypothetical protein Dimus_010339 [Dionaea muscipula]
MNKATASAAKLEDCGIRITRARAKNLGPSRGQIQKPPRQDQKRFLHANCKRSVSDENKKQGATTACLQNKKRAVLKDVTNVLCGKSYAASSNAAKIQAKNDLCRMNIKVGPCVCNEIKENTDLKQKIAKDEWKVTAEAHMVISSVDEKVDCDPVIPSKLTDPPHNLTSHGKLVEALLVACRSGGSADLMQSTVPSPVLVRHSSSKTRLLENLLKKNLKHGAKSETSKDPGIVDIDSNQKDPQACSLYAPDIYDSKRIAELNQRRSTDYMERVQRDITESMRGILIDWLVEVSEEYKLVPDTLYLTVNLIDRFLSQNYIEKQRLQLLGVSCMLIASKYEEICAPRVEEFCFITDNTYTRDEVLKMESHVLNFLRFQLSVPTTKTFLRRFVQAAQATCKVVCECPGLVPAPSFDLEYLANYLAELTLIDYSFLKYLPSLIAASAVFVARWTLDQSAHPWNPTMEYYTCYKAQDLQFIATAMQDLQSNTNSCPLNAIREKYRQQKFNCVANLSSPKPIQSLF